MKLDLYSNHTNYEDGSITWIQCRELGDKDFTGQKENEIYFGIDTNNAWSYDTSDEFVNSIMLSWIDWINNQIRSNNDIKS